MKKSKLLIVISIIFIAVGLISFTVAFASVGWDINKLATSQVKYSVIDSSSTQHDLSSVQKVKIKVDTSDVKISYGVELSITYSQSFTLRDKPITKVKTSVQNGTFLLSTRTIWYRTILSLFDFQNESVQIVLPRDKNIDLDIETDTGDVKFIGDASAQTSSVILETDTGDVVMQDVIVDNLKIEGDTGDIKIVGSDINLANFETDTGDISINNCTVQKADFSVDTGSIKILNSSIDQMVAETDTGDVKITESTIRISKISTDTGDIDGRGVVFGISEMKIFTDTGDVKLTLSGQREEYSFLINVKTGDSNITSTLGGDKLVDVSVKTGDVKIYFA